MDQIGPSTLLGLAPLAFIPIFHKCSPASKSTKYWTSFHLALSSLYCFFPAELKRTVASTRSYALQNPIQAAVIALAIAVPLKYLQQKLRYSRLNAIKWKYGYTDDPKTWQDMTIEQAQEIERNMAEVSNAPIDAVLA